MEDEKEWTRSKSECGLTWLDRTRVLVKGPEGRTEVFFEELQKAAATVRELLELGEEGGTE